jgi:hypothetical protein
MAQCLQVRQHLCLKTFLADSGEGADIFIHFQNPACSVPQLEIYNETSPKIDGHQSSVNGPELSH